jgi:hypothetical protein
MMGGKMKEITQKYFEKVIQVFCRFRALVNRDIFFFKNKPNIK